MRADLHLHTVFSDGAYSPEELARRVKSAGVLLMSVTDHDSMEGTERARAAAEANGLCFADGWEVSSYRDDGKVHVLGYGCKKNVAYASFLKERTDGAYVRAQDVLNKANGYFNLHFTMDDVEERHTQKSAPVHTMHVVRLFSDRLGIAVGELYDSVFSYGKPAYSSLFRPTPEDAIRVIHDMQGIAVLAHPGKIYLADTPRETVIEELILRGLDGIECYHSAHNEEAAAHFTEIAKRHGLLVTGGSDYHAEGSRNRVIGQPVFYASDRLLQVLFP